MSLPIAVVSDVPTISTTGIVSSAELVDHRLREDHVVDQRGVPRDEAMARAGVQAGEHRDPALVFGLPLPT